MMKFTLYCSVWVTATLICFLAADVISVFAAHLSLPRGVEDELACPPSIAIPAPLPFEVNPSDICKESACSGATCSAPHPKSRHASWPSVPSEAGSSVRGNVTRSIPRHSRADSPMVMATSIFLHQFVCNCNENANGFDCEACQSPDETKTGGCSRNPTECEKYCWVDENNDGVNDVEPLMCIKFVDRSLPAQPPHTEEVMYLYCTCCRGNGHEGDKKTDGERS